MLVGTLTQAAEPPGSSANQFCIWDALFTLSIDTTGSFLYIRLRRDRPPGTARFPSLVPRDTLASRFRLRGRLLKPTSGVKRLSAPSMALRPLQRNVKLGGP